MKSKTTRSTRSRSRLIDDETKQLSESIRRMERDLARERDTFYWTEYPDTGEDFNEDDLPVYCHFLKMSEHQIWQEDLTDTIKETLRHANIAGDLQITRERLVEIAATAKRQQDYIVTRKARVLKLEDGTEQTFPEERKSVSAAEINRELQVLKRIFSLAIQSGRIAMKPAIKMLREAPARAGFFEPQQYRSVLSHLPAELQSVITFAYITGWRVYPEVLPLQWRQVDFDADEIRLDAGTTKNGEGRVFPMTVELRTVLKARQTEHDRLKKAGHIVPQVFFREVADGRGGDKKPYAIISLNKAWQRACRLAGCPGRIPHDLRRTAVRNLVRAGVPERVAMELTGHKTRSVFERYNITSVGDLRDAAHLLDVAASVAAPAASTPA